MLSYQHIYHAGNRADLHKHAALSRALDDLKEKAGDDPILYIETHAGRGLYDLRSAEAKKTGEAAEGWLKLIDDKAALAALPSSYIAAVRAVNKGQALHPFYPGSPKIAAHILRTQDRLYLYDLHPAEFAALQKTMQGDKRARVEQADGLEAAIQSATLHARTYKHALIFIDPSFEIKSEYETVPAVIDHLHNAFPQAQIILWLPILPAARHETTLSLMKDRYPGLHLSQTLWANPAAGRGMAGSLLLILGSPRKP